VKTNQASTPATAFVWVAPAPNAVPTPGSGVSALKRMRDDQDATTGFLAWGPPV